MNAELSGKTALVTGSTTGLGLEIAAELGRRGAKIALNYCHNGQRADRALAELKHEGIEVALFQASVIDDTEIRRLVSSVGTVLGPVDILVVNATPDQPQRALPDYSWSDYQTMLDFFVKSPVLLTQAVLPHMASAQWGRIINIGSEVVHRAPAHFSAYVAAKGAQHAWTRAMARELAPHQITVNMVSPGWIPVERHRHTPPEDKLKYLTQIPMGRWGVPADVAVTAAALASPTMDFVTGQCIGVSGGMTIA